MVPTTAVMIERIQRRVDLTVAATLEAPTIARIFGHETFCLSEAV
jgi:hypothetical protein